MSSAFLCFSVLGIKSADQGELNTIASPPQSEFTSFIGNFRALSSLQPLVTPRVCATSGGSYSSDGIHVLHTNTLCVLKKLM